MLSSGRDGRHVPHEQEWRELIVKLIDAVFPTASPN